MIILLRVRIKQTRADYNFSGRNTEFIDFFFTVEKYVWSNLIDQYNMHVNNIR